MSEVSVPRASDGVANQRVRPRRARNNQTKPTGPAGPVFLCAGCDRPIRGATGYLEVNTAAAGERVRHFEAHRLERAVHADVRLMAVGMNEVMAEYFAAAPVAQWTAWHRRCDPEPSSSTYWIGAERIATWPQLVDWTAHLSDKRWFPGTDWYELTRGLAS